MENNQAAKKAFARYAERQGRPPKNQDELIEHYAVKTAMKHLESEGKSGCIELIKFVYFYDPKNINRKGEMERRMVRFSMRHNVSVRTAYYWQTVVCNSFNASLAGLVQND